MWCGVVSNCPIQEGDMVTVGCYAQYDWLSQLLQYNPIVSLNASLQFDGLPETLDGPRIPIVPPPATTPPKSEHLMTSYNYNYTTVKVGDKIDITCTVNFTFDRSTAYSGRNKYADNPLNYTCRIQEYVNCE